MLFITLLFIVAAGAAQQQVCSRGQSNLVIGFDDINLSPSDSTSSIPWPYNDFLFVRGGAWADKHVPVINTTGSPYFSTSAGTGPNVIITTGEALTLQQVVVNGNRTFQLLGVSLTSIFIDKMGVLVQLLRNGTVVNTVSLVLPIQVRTPVSLGVPLNVDSVIIGCANQDYAYCAHIAYDDFALCYKHSK